MAAKGLLSDGLGRATKAPEKGSVPIFVPDAGTGAVRGFKLRVTSAGARSWVLDYRFGGRERQITIGSFPDWSAAQAREKAAEYRKAAGSGTDPFSIRDKAKAPTTVNDLAGAYIEEGRATKRPRSLKEDEDILRLHILPPLGKKRLVELTREAIRGLHREIGKTRPVRANRVLAVLRAMLNFAMGEERQWVTANATAGIAKYKEHARQRFLSPAEVARLTDALGAAREKASANALKLLLLTGARRGEVLGATWAQFDLESGVWIKPHTAVKQKKEHRLPLNAAAKALLVQMRTEADKADAERAKKGLAPSPFLFPSATEFQSLANIKRSWNSVCRAAKIGELVPKTFKAKPVLDKDGKPVMKWKSDCRIHDLRHSYASILASRGMSLQIIGALLGHSQISTTQRYAHLLDDTLRAATEAAGAVIESAGKPSAEVVKLKA